MSVSVHLLLSRQRDGMTIVEAAFTEDEMEYAPHRWGEALDALRDEVLMADENPLASVCMGVLVVETPAAEVAQAFKRGQNFVAAHTATERIPE